MNKVVERLYHLQKEDQIDLSVVEFVRFLSRIEKPNDIILTSGAAVMHFHLNGHICISKNDISDFVNEFDLPVFSLNELIKASMSSVIISDGISLTPLVLEGENLYLHRFWKYENELVEWLKNKSHEMLSIPDNAKAHINLLFPAVKNETNWQKTAVLLSHLKKLLIITGGPGTGKTFTIQKILESHLQYNESIKVALCAPTGKAAQRLNESLNSEFLKTPIEPAKTIHSLLGAKGITGKYDYGSDNKLNFDLIIVDEASMLDLNLWISLIRSVPDYATLILLGDKNQLASVEAGSILGDICSSSSNIFSDQLSETLGLEKSTSIKSTINDSIIELTKSYRFDEKSGINKLSEAIINDDSDLVISIFEDDNFPDVKFVEPSNESMDKLIQFYVIDPFLRMNEKNFSHEGFKRYQILCALRKGPYGVEHINKRSEDTLKKKLKVSLLKEWYPGRSIILSRNDYSLQLRNGENGFAVQNNFNSGFEIQFEGKDYPINSSRIADYESGNSLTVHKSQGSEFDHVALVLPNSENLLLTRELLYTSVTRARKTILVIGNENIIRSAITRRIERRSGIKYKIWDSSN